MQLPTQVGAGYACGRYRTQDDRSLIGRPLQPLRQRLTAASGGHHAGTANVQMYMTNKYGAPMTMTSEMAMRRCMQSVARPRQGSA